MSKQELKQRGFTIIEVVLVLAIAALIFLMVFIALPALQRSQRDTARKNDVSIVASAVSSWQGNNRATTGWPTGAQVQSYATNVSGNTTTINVKPVVTAAITPATVEATIDVYPQAVCSNAAVTGSQVSLAKGSARQYATVTMPESGNAGYCLDS